ncbi:AbrB/MazE/SpoVT family DNA-binding domain-containing protein [Sphingomonas sp. TX0522]|uniref:AbrB/MazE/SpoVT family DNA-binding domain-containing protein n=1 Tax=Sphingomonas sp. TX0522 TaxID=2479205 RepID=UPI0018DF5689|nr:AbrB/MazE/SpoVT family DNA-binding domain-containing protein [Sphingomonas sp. TX0522]MBI0533065.1 AbrB/MazE/SpoVT family DNA-binding domain-containing protein [Sphingomonas sp. TX0522]
MTVQVAVTASGRMSLPADIRKRLGLAKGGAIYVDETPDGVVLRTAEQVVAHARALAKQYDEVGGGTVDDFLANRVAESGQ